MRRDGGSPAKAKKKTYRGASTPLSGTQYVRPAPAKPRRVPVSVPGEGKKDPRAWARERKLDNTARWIAAGGVGSREGLQRINRMGLSTAEKRRLEQLTAEYSRQVQDKVGRRMGNILGSAGTLPLLGQTYATTKKTVLQNLGLEPGPRQAYETLNGRRYPVVGEPNIGIVPWGPMGRSEKALDLMGETVSAARAARRLALPAEKATVDLAYHTPPKTRAAPVGLTPKHETTVRSLTRAQRNYSKARLAAKGSKSPEAKAALDRAELRLGEAKNRELYARLEAQADTRVDAAHPHYANRQAISQRLVKTYAKRQGALPPGMKNTKQVQERFAFLEHLARKGEYGREWYENSARAIMRATRGDKDRAEQIAQLVAIYSPQQPILGNTSLAIRAYNEFLRTRKVTAGQDWQKEAAERVLRGEGGWDGRKTNNFYRNFVEDIFEGDTAKLRELGIEGREVTSDLWMARAFGYHTDAVSEGRYDMIESMTRQLADEFGWRPKGMQAAIWTAIKEGSDDVSANIDFATGIERHLAQIGGEVTRGGDPALIEAYAGWTPEIRESYLRAKSRLLDDFVEEIGVLSPEGEYLKVGTSAPPRIGTKVSYRLTATERKLLDATSAAIARAMGRDSVSWVRPLKPQTRGAVDLIEIQLGRTATPEEASQLYQLLNPTGAMRFVVQHTDGGLFVRNISRLPNYAARKTAPDFHKTMAAVTQEVFPEVPPTVGYASDGRVINGADYERHLRAAFGNRRGPGEVRFQAAADRLSGGTGELDRAFLADAERAARELGAPATRGTRPRVAARLKRIVEETQQVGIVPPWMRPEMPVLAAEERAAGPALRAVPSPPEQRIAQSLEDVTPVREAQEAGYTVERRRRFGKQATTYESAGGGLAGHAASKEALAGKYPKLNFKGFEHLSGEDELDQAIRTIYDSSLTQGQKIRASDALKSAVQDGVVPSRSEIAYLKKVFPKEVEKVTAAAEEAAQRSLLRKIMLEAGSAPRTLQTTFDVSYLLRQGLVAGTRHPALWGKSVIPSFKAMPKEGFEAAQDALVARPSFDEATEYGVHMTDMEHGVERAEENYMAPYLAKLPGVSHSANAYTYFLNKLRLDMWDQLAPAVKQSAEEGKGVFQLPWKRGVARDADKALEDLAAYINAATGRGTGGKTFEKVAPIAAKALFSPRLLKSRFDFLNPVWYARMDPAVRAQALSGAATTIGQGMLFLGLASQIPGVSVGMDPRSANFGRIRIGDTRIDLWGGHQPIVRLYAQLLTGVYIASTSGKEFNLAEGGFGKSTRWDILQNFARSKFAPNLSLVADYLDRQGPVGGEFKWRDQWKRFVPMLAGDVLETYQQWNKKESGPASAGAAAGAAALGTVGIGVQTYGDKRKRPDKEPKTPDQEAEEYIKKTEKVLGPMPPELKHAVRDKALYQNLQKDLRERLDVSDLTQKQLTALKLGVLAHENHALPIPLDEVKTDLKNANDEDLKKIDSWVERQLGWTRLGEVSQRRNALAGS